MRNFHIIFITSFILFFGGLTATTSAQDLHWEMPREEVIAVLGEPESVVVGNRRELLIYPDGVRVELHDGVVMGAKGLRLLTKPEDAFVADAASNENVQIALPATPSPAAEKSPVAGEAAASPSPEEEIFTAGSPYSLLEDYAEEDLEEYEEEQSGLPTAFVFILRFLIAAIAIKVACETSGASIFLGGIALISIIDVSLRMGLKWVFGAAGDWGMLLSAGHLDYVIPFLVMLGTVSTLTSAKSFPSALRVTATTQVITFFAWLIVISVSLALFF